MKKDYLKILSIVLLSFVMIGCSDDDSGSSAVVSGKVKATVDGEDYEKNGVASFVDFGGGTVSTTVSSIIDINSDNNEGSFTISVPLSPGETGTFNLNEDISPSGGLGLSFGIDGGTSYTAQLTDGSNIATIEVTDYSNDKISGTFSGTLTSASGTETIEIENGTFTDIELQ